MWVGPKGEPLEAVKYKIIVEQAIKVAFRGMRNRQKYGIA